MTTALVDADVDFIAFADNSLSDNQTLKIRIDRFLDSVNGYGLGIASDGLLFVEGNAFLENEQFEPSEDRIMFLSHDNSTTNTIKRETWGDIVTLTAGVGIGANNGTYRFNPVELVYSNCRYKRTIPLSSSTSQRQATPRGRSVSIRFSGPSTGIVPVCRRRGNSP